MAKERLYMAVTPDKYELPIYVTADKLRLAEWLGKSEAAINSAIARGYSGKRNGYKVIKVEY